MKVVPVLVNHWADCEFGGSAKDVGFYESGFRSPGYGYSLSFRDYASTLASHYANEPAIAFWQLANEAEAPSPAAAASTTRRASNALRGFAAEMTQTVKAADPNHLVSLGTMGSGQCGTANGDYRAVHEPVDICEYHDYDYEGNPADNADNPMPGDEWNGLAERLDPAEPMASTSRCFVGEVGISSDVSLERRAEFFAAKLEAQTAAGVDGFALWDKVLESLPTRPPPPAATRATGSATATPPRTSPAPTAKLGTERLSPGRKSSRASGSARGRASGAPTSADGVSAARARGADRATARLISNRPPDPPHGRCCRPSGPETLAIWGMNRGITGGFGGSGLRRLQSPRQP